MKSILHITILIAASALIFCGPKTSETPEKGLADTTWLHDPEPDPWASPTATYTGVINDVQVKFQHNRYTTYRLINGTDTIIGNLNTERGFQDDEDATLYILYYEMPDSVLAHFVRMTDGRILMLDVGQNQLSGDFRKE